MFCMEMRIIVFSVWVIHRTSNGFDKLSTFKNCRNFLVHGVKSMKQLAFFIILLFYLGKSSHNCKTHIFHANHLIFTVHGISTLVGTPMHGVKGTLILDFTTCYNNSKYSLTLKMSPLFIEHLDIVTHNFKTKIYYCKTPSLLSLSPLIMSLFYFFQNL